MNDTSPDGTIVLDARNGDVLRMQPLRPRVWDVPTGPVATWYVHSVSPDQRSIMTVMLWGPATPIGRSKSVDSYRWRVKPESGVLYHMRGDVYYTKRLGQFQDVPELQLDAPLISGALPARILAAPYVYDRDGVEAVGIRTVPIVRGDSNLTVPPEEYRLSSRSLRMLWSRATIDPRYSWFVRLDLDNGLQLPPAGEVRVNEYALPDDLHPILMHSIPIEEAIQRGVPPGVRFVQYDEPTYRNISRLADAVGVQPSNLPTDLDPHEPLARDLRNFGLVTVHDLDQMMRERPQTRVWFLGRDSDTIFAAFRQRYGDRVQYGPGFNRTFPFKVVASTAEHFGISPGDVIVDTGFAGTCVKPFMSDVGTRGYLIAAAHPDIPSAVLTATRAFEEGRDPVGTWEVTRNARDTNFMALSTLASRAIIRAEHLDVVREGPERIASDRMNVAGIRYDESDTPIPFEVVDLHQLTPNNLQAWMTVYNVFSEAVEAGPRGRLVPVLWSSRAGRLPVRAADLDRYDRSAPGAVPADPGTPRPVPSGSAVYRTGPRAALPAPTRSGRVLPLRIRNALQEAARRALSVLRRGR